MTETEWLAYRDPEPCWSIASLAPGGLPGGSEKGKRHGPLGNAWGSKS
jgi:hypothetical protein